MKTSTQFFNWRKAIKQSELPSSTRLVLFVIADYANAMDDVCWPSLERIASDAGLSVRCVSDHIRVAETAGWLTSWLTRRANRRHAHSCYRLSVPADVAARFRAAIDFELADDAAAGIPAQGLSSFADDSEPDMSLIASGAPPVVSPFADESKSMGVWDAHCPAPTENSASGGDQLADRMQNLPTNTPVNRNTSKPSLSQPIAVNEGIGDGESEFKQRDHALASWMLERIRKLNPGHREPDLRAWAAEIRDMRGVDGRTHEQIAVLFRWANEDDFWQPVVIAPEKLREKWDQLVIRFQAAKRKATKADAPRQVVAVPPADDRVCAHVENGCRCTSMATTIIGAGSSRRGYCRQHIGKYED
ncbi:MAG: helix-turn-helix domain-containing protein [Rudaea sp.]|nr:helix-turn-helix domain-containing protein [Rudaea sp.]